MREAMIDIDKIEAAAKAATPGPWEVKPSCNEIMNADHGLLPFAISHGYTLIGALYENGADAAHISTANPAAVLEIVSMIRKRDAVLKQALEALELYETETDSSIQRCAIAAIKKVINQ